MALSKQRHRQQPSDPFSDPTSVSYSSYGVPTLTRNAPPKQSSQRPPPPPPKVPPKSSASRMPNGDPIQEAVREVVTVRRVEPSPRTRPTRSQTQLPPASTSRPAPPPTRRSVSQDSSAAANAITITEKDKGKARRGIATNKKGSSHADVIDRLDFSGVGPMFHHDGPFDACAPSRNRHRTKAPMYAWSGAPDEDKDAFAAARSIPANIYPSPYPSPGVYAPYEPPKKKHDAIAEAWGVHEPEPFEDFSAGGGFNPRVSGEYTHSSRPNAPGSGASRRTRDGRDPRDKYREYLDDAQPPAPRRQQQPKRGVLPPPQPIFVPESDAAEVVNPPSPTLPASPGAPKRSKSLMHRIRKMRDAPNVPVAYEEMQNDGSDDVSPTSSAENAAGPRANAQAPSRPTHRSQNSFLGRLGRAPNKEGTSPTTEAEQFVYVDEPSRPIARKDKSLPATPPIRGDTSGEYMDGYFDSTGGGYAGSPGGLGRKTSLLRKMKGVVKGTAAK